MSQQQNVYDRVIKFMTENDIDSNETIYQCDWVIEHAYEFIEDLFKIVEPELNYEPLFNIGDKVICIKSEGTVFDKYPDVIYTVDNYYREDGMDYVTLITENDARYDGWDADRFEKINL